MKILQALSLTFALAALSTGVSAASTTGTIRGESRPSEQIVVVNEASGAIVGVMSDAKGHFEATDLPAGQYHVARASAPSKAAGAPVLAGRVTDVVLPPTN
jgi:hypothetical protein